MRGSGRRQNVRVSSVGYGLAAIILIGFVSVTLVFHGQFASLLAAATSSISSRPVVLFFMPYGGTALTVGATADVDLDIEADVPINALGVTVSFPKDELEVVGISKARSFLDLWTEDTVIKEESGELHFSGGTTRKGGLVGSSTVLTFTVRAKKAGTAAISVEDAQIFAGDGKGSPLEADTRSLAFSIAPIAAAPAPAQANAGGTLPQPKAPNPDLNGDGKVSLVDVSIMILHLLLPYDPRYDLNGDGSVGLADLSILFAKMSGR